MSGTAHVGADLGDQLRGRDLSTPGRSHRFAAPGTAALLPVLGTALIIGAGCAASPEGCGRILALPPMRAVGRVSYSWYLWHWPVLLFLPALLDRPMGLADRLAAVAISGGLAMLTLHLVEDPVRLAGRLRRSAIGSLAVGGVATAVAVCVGVALLVWVPAPVGRSLAAQTLSLTLGPPPVGGNVDQYNTVVQHAFAQVQAAVAASAGLPDVPSNLDPPLADADTEGEKERTSYQSCFLDFPQVDQPTCAMGDTASATSVALVGDSNAWMWGTGFLQVAAQRHWRLDLMTKSGCPLLDLPALNPRTSKKYPECDQWRDQIITRLRTEHPQLIVLSTSRRYGARYAFPASFTSYDPAWTASLTRMVQQLRGTGAQVLVLGPIPDPQSRVPTCLSLHLDDATACSPTRSEAVNEPGITAETDAVKAGSGQYADITGLFCTTERCPVIVGNTLVYFDQNHTTIEYAQVLAPVLGALADRALICG